MSHQEVRIRQVARLLSGIDPNVVTATDNCMHPEEPGPLHELLFSSPNVLTSDEHFDLIFGSPDLARLIGKVYKVKKNDMKDVPKGAYRLQRYGRDIGTVPYGSQE